MSKIFKPNIILVGFMASGKSAVAKRLAAKLKMPLLDTDALIENEERIKIKDIFRIRGEPYFRKLERKIVKRISRLMGMVVATGGGIVLDAENRRALRRCGTAFYLKVNPDAALKRIKRVRNNERPLLKSKRDLKGEMKRLLKLREPYYYACAHYVVDTSKMTVGEVVKKIVNIRNRSI